MTAEIGERLLWMAGLVLLGLAAWRLLNRAILRRAGRSLAGSSLFASGKPAILYFTTPDCVTCKTFQRPMLERLKSRLGDAIQVVEINAQEKPDLASQWGVMSVPTIFIIAPDGKPCQVNHGAVSADQLLSQLSRCG